MEKILFQFCIFISIFYLGCSNDDKNQKPEEKIIGKWVQIGIGFGGEIIIDNKPNEDYYTEFLPIGKIRIYSSNEYVERYAYQIDDNWLYWDIISKEEVIGGHWKFKYEFYDDKIKLEIVEGLVNNWDTFIYKKKK